ncbi:hypothetical protein TSUD_234940 [Trifolium subterraneum]|uniref:Phospholipase D n=1 Tax=Trifolium subterraneum TaxID=3900 RepID=A0A2Z6MAX3_TRISU|nr:hypothetical protein TSUD_234940 [Trifolium subterraneum]
MADTGGDGNGFVYLHGDLDLTIVAARRLPNMDIVSERFRRCVTACDTIKYNSTSDSADGSSHRNHHHRRKIITSDPYVTVMVPQATVARTRVLKNSPDPVWKERFNIPLAHAVMDLEFRVKDDDVFGSQTMGTVKISAQRIASGDLISDWFPIIGANGKPPKPDTALNLEMKFTPVDQNPLYLRGIAADPEHKGVRNTYFPVRKGSTVRLYQDAHCHIPDGMAEIKLDGGKVYKPENCWEDICYAITEAHHMIYLVGWSIYHKIKLVREPSRELPRGGDLTLGELLKYKSEEGVVGTVFTHHQKCVILDSQAAGNNRKITTFIGGLDLCDGRYDTPEHRLFRDLDTVFAGDFHNPTFPSGTRAPRQPWHDLHCRIDGPAAYDILINFEQRWRKSTKWKEFAILFKKASQWNDDALIRVERISWILSPSNPPSKNDFTSIPADDPLVWVSSEDDPENWHVQIFRSIDSGSLKGFPKRFEDALSQNLICAKNLVIDKSIQTGYIQAIRSAQHFIYIENQYFIGSSYAWPSYKDAGADNLIPMELALKIASKIKAKERFAIYIVLPMWPEVQGSGFSSVRFREHNGQTMQMMYNVVANALKSMQLGDVHPQDYLNFYCLGNREHFNEESSSSNGAPIYGYRMSLWAEHLGMLDETFKEPERLECVRKVNEIANDNWRIYSSEEMSVLQGHLLKYPVQIDSDGQISSLPDCENFPDAGGKILGAHSATIPDILTT